MPDPPSKQYEGERVPISPLKAARMRRGITQDAVAEHFGLPLPTVWRHEQHGHPLPLLWAVRYARFYGIPMETLYGYLDDLYPRGGNETISASS